MMRTPRKVHPASRRRTERGSHLLELAIALPIFISLGLASAEFGRLFYQTTTLANSTRLAARYLTTAAFTTQAKRDAAYANAKNLAVYGTTTPSGVSPVYPGLTTANISISTAGGVMAALPDTVTVSVTGVTFQPKVNLGSVLKRPGLTLAVPLAPSTTMRYLIQYPLNY
jgi:Flp pilus assembly protein TadG